MKIVDDPLSAHAVVIPRADGPQQFEMHYLPDKIPNPFEDNIFEILVTMDSTVCWRSWYYAAYKDGVFYHPDHRLSDEETRILIKLVRDEGLTPYQALEFLDL